MVRDASLKDLDEIARLHKESFHGHFLPKLGVELLARYYEAFLDEDNIFLININSSGEIDGLLLGTPNSAIGRREFIRKNRIALTLRVCLLLLSLDRDAWVRVRDVALASLFTNRKRVEDNGEKVPDGKLMSLLSICVSPESKGRGVSRRLVEEFERRLFNERYEGYVLSVQKENNRANNFYNKIGMEVYKETDDECAYLKRWET